MTCNSMNLSCNEETSAAHFLLDFEKSEIKDLSPALEGDLGDRSRDILDVSEFKYDGEVVSYYITTKSQVLTLSNEKTFDESGLSHTFKAWESRSFESPLDIADDILKYEHICNPI